MPSPSVPTPHIQALEGEIAETILLLGNPFRVECTTGNFLEDARQFNATRNMFGYTGTYKEERASVMDIDAGCPSIGIYSHELTHFYGCKDPICVGTVGAFDEKPKVRSMVFAMGTCTTSNYVHLLGLPRDYSCTASYELLLKAAEEAKVKGLTYHVRDVLSPNIFYGPAKSATDGMTWSDAGVLVMEIEAVAPYSNAAATDVSTLCIVTISDSVVAREATTAEERQTTFTNMVEVALSLA